ncbi:dipeptidyl aminopeptidase [Bdellovibrio bacteriovorus]|uniref:extracellular medium-chain-length polyhydroxyalkanoate depolymerase n=1 Tax=Bdellovibrio bacteriovorus TaxID=959 RepID=UPI0035A69DA9
MKKLLAGVFGVVAMSLSAQAAKKASNCEVTGLVDRMTCPYLEKLVSGPHLTRHVKYSLPKGKTPKAGWPTVILYQGSLFPVEFSRSSLMIAGGYNEIRLIQTLLDSGFAVIAPPAIEGVAWMTNIVGIDYDTSEDRYFVEELLVAMGNGEFGKLNMDRLYATGISSGGYHSSRMAVAFPGVFKALAVHSASYADCGGPMCFVPAQVPENHPPTIFLHGRLDPVVPVRTMYPYHETLKNQGVETEMFVSPWARHEWLEEAPELITNWFINHK